MGSLYTIVLDETTLDAMRIALGVALKRDEVPLHFDEQYYLEANPDVKAAVEDRVYRSGFEHYERHGRAEGRNPTRPVYAEHAGDGFSPPRG
jgi:hypothetical protein